MINLQNIVGVFSSETHLYPLQEIEAHIASRFSTQRRKEFSTGRYCARKALEQLGRRDVEIPRGSDRQPIWPNGFCGSISHCPSLTGAIVARTRDYLSLGLDIEETDRLQTQTYSIVFTESELYFLTQMPMLEAANFATTLFSLKEAFFKCTFPLTGLRPEFREVEIHINPDLQNASFKYKFLEDCCNNHYQAHYQWQKGRVLALVWIE